MKFKNLLVLGLTITLAVSCGPDSKTKSGEGTEEAIADPIVKTWMLDNIDASAAMEGMPEETKEQMKTMMDQMAADQKGKMTLDIRKDGKVVANAPDIEGNWKQSEGAWALGADKKSLTLTLDGKKEEFIVEELTENKLNIEMKGEKMNMIFVPKK